tara:strand:+ start:16 stop:396 length:381 start_codon:yes stop_codon:yes gene_type:complete
MPIDDPADYNLEIKESPIHGLGVFTKVDIKKNKKIIPYNFKEGNEMKWNDFKEKYGNDFLYTYSLRRVHKIICVKDNRNVITYINDDRPNENTYLKARALFAKRDIKAGEELTLCYPHYNPNPTNQ